MSVARGNFALSYHDGMMKQKPGRTARKSLFGSMVHTFEQKSLSFLPDTSKMRENFNYVNDCSCEHNSGSQCGHLHRGPNFAIPLPSFFTRHILIVTQQTVLNFIHAGKLMSSFVNILNVHCGQENKIRKIIKNDLLYSVISVGAVGSALTDLSGNLIFMCAFWSWLTAQLMKYFTAFYRENAWDWRVMFDSGGMPSSHTALVVGLTTAIAYQYGLGSALFPLSLAFSLIVMYDAAGVRRHAGKQAEVLNKILDDMFHGQPISDRKLKEVLGHSPLQVLAGAVLGVFIGILYMHMFGSGYAVLAQGTSYLRS